MVIILSATYKKVSQKGKVGTIYYHCKKQRYKADQYWTKNPEMRPSKGGKKGKKVIKFHGTKPKKK